MKNKSKELTPTEQLKSLKRAKKGIFLGEIGCCVAPFGILTAINFQDYFIKMEAWRTSLSFVMLAIMTLVSVGIVAKDKLKINLLNSLLTLAVVDGILWFMGELIKDLAFIILFIIVGFVGAFSLEMAKKKEVKKIAILEEGIKKAQVDKVADAYKKEQEEIEIEIQ